MIIDGAEHNDEKNGNEENDNEENDDEKNKDTKKDRRFFNMHDDGFRNGGMRHSE